MTAGFHPLQARTLDELAIDYLIDRVLTRLLRAEEDIRYPRSLAMWINLVRDDPSFLAALERVTALTLPALPAVGIAPALLTVPANAGLLDSWRGAWRNVVPRLLPPRSIDWNVSLDIQLPPVVQSALEVLAVDRLGSRRRHDPAATPLLAVAIQPREELPTLGKGESSLVEIGDPGDSISGANTAKLARLQESMSDRFRWTWTHAPAAIETAGGKAACVLESVARLHREDFWMTVRSFQKEWRRIQNGDFRNLLEKFKDVDVVLENSRSAVCRDAVMSDLAMLNAAGVPPQRPGFALGRHWFDGLQALQDFATMLPPGQTIPPSSTNAAV